MASLGHRRTDLCDLCVDLILKTGRSIIWSDDPVFVVCFSLDFFVPFSVSGTRSIVRVLASTFFYSYDSYYIVNGLVIMLIYPFLRFNDEGKLLILRIFNLFYFYFCGDMK